MITNISWPRRTRSPIRNAGKSSAFRSDSAGELSLRVSTLMWSIYALHFPLPRGQSMVRNAPRYTLRQALGRWILSSASDSFYEAKNAEIVKKRELDDLTEERSFDRCRRCYIFARYTDTPTRVEPFVIHPPLTSYRYARHRWRSCLRREREFMSSAQAVLSILLNLIRAGIAQRKSLDLRFKSSSPKSFTGYVSTFCLAKASLWLDQHHLSPITGRCCSPYCNYGRLPASRSNCVV